MGCAGPLRLAVSSCGGRSSTSVGSGTVKERELPETDGRGRVPEGSGASPGPGSLCDCPRSACWRRAQSGHAGGWGNQGLSKGPEDVAQQPQTAISFRVPAAAGAPWCGDVGGRRGRRSGNLPRMRRPGPPPLAPLRSFSSPNCCHGCLPITLRTQSRLLVSHLAPLANLLPPQPSQFLNFPKSWLPRASVWAVPPPRPLSSAQKTAFSSLLGWPSPPPSQLRYLPP